MGCKGLVAQGLCWLCREDPVDSHRHQNRSWDGCDHAGYDLVLTCHRFLGMQTAR